MTNHGDRFGFMNAGNPPVPIPTKTHFLIGSSYGSCFAALYFWKDFIFENSWTAVSILLSGFAIIAAIKGFVHVTIGTFQFFGTRYPKTFYASSMAAFGYLMYAQWTADAAYFATNGKHGPYFFLSMGLFLVMEYVLAKEWLKTSVENDMKTKR